MSPRVDYAASAAKAARLRAQGVEPYGALADAELAHHRRAKASKARRKATRASRKANR